MAILTPLGLEDARALGVLYGLNVVACDGILAGSVNSNFALTLGDGRRVFARVYEEQGVDTARHEAALLTHLARNGVPTPCPLMQENGDVIAAYRGKAFAVFPFLDGDVLCQRRVAPASTFAVGAALGRMHRVGADFDGCLASRFDAARLLERIGQARLGPGGEALGSLLDRLGEIVDAARLPPPDRVIHSDLFRDNVLFYEGSLVALLDFESASRGAASFDLMVTMLAWCFGDGFERDLATALVSGYRSERELSREDVEGLFPAARFAAARFSITRVTDFEQRPRGAGVYKDYRRFVARLSALDEMGAPGLRTLIGM